MKGFKLLLFTIGLMALTQVISKFGSFEVKEGNLFNIFTISAIGLFGIRTLIWANVLKKVSLSIAYPFLSLNFVLILILSSILFDETLTFTKVTGGLLIGIGVLFLAKK